DDSVAMARVINVPPRGIGQKTVGELDRWARELSVSWFEALRRLREGDPGGPKLTARAESGLFQFLEALEALVAARGQLDVVALIEHLLTVSGYREHVLDGSEEGDERWQNIQELATVALPYAELAPPAGLAALLEETSLVADVDGYDEESDAVSMITFHAAKGLEFPVVFLVGMEEGVAPHSRSFDNPDQMEEERRLA